MGANLPTIEQNAQVLLKQIAGEPTHCKACNARIWFIRHRNGKMVPYTEQLLNHFIDCKYAVTFKREQGHG
jgi:hypothetical protein